jgi:CheY-like chemotaxis protein
MTSANATILVVDDVSDNRDLLIRRLKRLELTRVDQAANGVDGFPKAHEPAGQPHGEPRVEAFVSGLRTPADQLLQALIRQVREFEASRSAFDDMAAVLLSLGRTAAS